MAGCGHYGSGIGEERKSREGREGSGRAVRSSVARTLQKLLIVYAETKRGIWTYLERSCTLLFHVLVVIGTYIAKKI